MLQELKVICPSCKDLATFSLPEVVWFEVLPRNSLFVCPKCGANISQAVKEAGRPSAFKTALEIAAIVALGVIVFFMSETAVRS